MVKAMALSAALTFVAALSLALLVAACNRMSLRQLEVDAPALRPSGPTT